MKEIGLEIQAYLDRSGLPHQHEGSTFYVGPLAVDIGPKGAEIKFRNLGAWVTPIPPGWPVRPQNLDAAIQTRNKGGWVTVVRTTNDADKIISYIENLLIPSSKQLAPFINVAKSKGMTMSDLPPILIVGSDLFEREDIYEAKRKEGEAFDSLWVHGNICTQCRKSGFLQLAIPSNPKSLCNKGNKLWEAWNTNNEYASELSGPRFGRAKKPKPRQFGHARPIKPPTKHPHKGMYCAKKDPNGRCIKWEKFKKPRKNKAKKSKVKWKH